MPQLMEALRRYTEPALLGAIGLGALISAGALIVYDVVHSPVRTYSAVATAASLPPVTPTAAKERALSADQSAASIEAAARMRGDLTNFTLFRRVPVEFGNGRNYSVVTGFVYPNTNAPAPGSQYCYLEAEIISAKATITLPLASKDEAAGVIDSTSIGQADAKAIGLPLNRIRESVASCRFI